MGQPSSDEKIWLSGPRDKWLQLTRVHLQGCNWRQLALFSWDGLPEAHLPVEVELSADPKGVLVNLTGTDSFLPAAADLPACDSNTLTTHLQASTPKQCL